MGLMHQLGQAVDGMMGGQGGQSPLLQVLTSLLGKDGNIGGLAGLLPDLVDKLTPNGKIEAGGLEQLLKFVQGR